MTTFIRMYHPLIASTITSPVLVSQQSADDHAAQGWLLVDPNGTLPDPVTPYYTKAAADSRYVRDAELDAQSAPLMSGTGATAVALRAAFAPKWQANTAYASGYIVMNPSGQIVSANTAFTSGSSYNATNWTVVSDGQSAKEQILTKVARALRSKIRPNQGIAVELNGTTYRLWQRLSPGQWLGTYLDVRANTNGGATHLINQYVMVTPSVLVAEGDVSITQVGTWTDAGAYRHSVTAGDTQTFTSPANTTRVGVQCVRTTNGGLAKVSINGDASRARLLPTAQDMVERGLFPNTILVANGGTLNPTDRVIDTYWNGGALQTVNALAAEDLPPTATGHVITYAATGYKQAASAAARAYFGGFIHGQAQTLGDVASLPVLTLDGGAGGSATEYAFSGKPAAAGSNAFMGAIHDNEGEDSLTVTVDDVATTLTSGVPVFPGREAVITKVSHLLHPNATGSVASITTRYILNRDGLTTDVAVTWAQAMIINAAYSMLPLNGKLQVTGAVVRAFFDRGDLLENGAGPLRFGLNSAADTYMGVSKSAAAWMWDSLGRIAAGMYVEDVLAFTNNWAQSGTLLTNIEDRNGTLTKAYVSRVGGGTETVANGTVWAWRTHYLFGLMPSPEAVFAA